MVEVYGYSIVTIPVIATIVYGIIELAKYLFSDKTDKKINKYLPIIAAILGGILSVASFFLFPEIIPASTWYSSLVMGMASGLSSVGVHQITKQINGGNGNAS
jgi:hypothetical protein